MVTLAHIIAFLPVLLGLVPVPSEAGSDPGARLQWSAACPEQRALADARRGQEDAETFAHSSDDRLRIRIQEEARPICLTVGKVHLRIPRNYLYSHSSWQGGNQDSVTIEVNYPGLQPFSGQTRGCFERREACSLQQLTIENSNRSSDTFFEGARPFFHNQEPIRTPDGYDKYEVGPRSQRVEYFTKHEHGGPLTFDCNPPTPSIGFLGLCTRFMPFLDSTIIFYRFSYADIPGEERRDARLRTLVGSFVEEDGSWHN